MQGIVIPEPNCASEICKAAFDIGLIVETSGPNDEVVKFLPPLIIDKEGINQGFDILEVSMEHVLKK